MGSNKSQNIHLFDGSVVGVGCSTVVPSEQHLEANQINLSQQFINMLVSDRVVKPAGMVMTQGANLSHLNQLGHTQFIYKALVVGCVCLDPRLSV